jgi:hypothetical protein
MLFIPFWSHVTDLSQVQHKNLVLSLLGPGFNSISLDIIKYEEHRNFTWFYVLKSSFVLT